MDDVLQTAIADALQELGFGEVAFSLEHPENLTFGDYATNAPIVVAKEAGKSRLEGKDYLVQDGDVMHLRFNV